MLVHLWTHDHLRSVRVFIAETNLPVASCT
jgi:hypothetical protein